MLVGVISDSHDNLPNLRQALAELASRGVKTIFHCGDLISPFVTKELGEFAGEVHTVFGNNDGDRFLAQKIGAERAPNLTHHGEFGVVEVDGCRIALTHYKEYALGMAASNQCDAAFFGHSHIYEEVRVGEKLVLNPGELLGLLGKPSFCVYDTKRGEAEHIEFDHQPWG